MHGTEEAVDPICDNRQLGCYFKNYPIIMENAYKTTEDKNVNESNGYVE